MAAPVGRSRAPFLYAGAIVAAVAVAAWAVWWWYRNAPPPVDMVAVLQENNRGIGLMDQFEYHRAAQVFDAVRRRAPGWSPATINLGIALLNTTEPTQLARAVALFNEVRQSDPHNNYANFCLGIITDYQGDPAAAGEYFAAVTRREPEDPHAWAFLGKCYSNQDQRERARVCYEKALALNPYMPAALNQLQLLLRQDDPKRADELLTRFKDLTAAHWTALSDVKYGEMGKYAEVIGRGPDASHAVTGPLPAFVRQDDFRVVLAPGTRWATSADLGPGELRRLVRKRFGGTVVALDDGTTKPALLLLAAVVRGGRLEDLLLQRDAGGYADITEAAGLAGPSFGLGCAVADFDNDGRPDLLITGAGKVRLFRNVAGVSGWKFADVTDEATLDPGPGIYLGAAFVDIDQDSDLDIVLTRYAASEADAVKRLQNMEAAESGVGAMLFLNVGEAAPRDKKHAGPLRPKYRKSDNVLPAVRGATVNLLISDLDTDGDIDLMFFADGRAPQPILNDRLLKFHPRALPDKGPAVGTWNGGVVLDANRDERADLLLVGPGQPPRFLVQGKASSAAWFSAGPTDSPPLVQAQAVDLDLDGWTDVVGLSEDRLPVLLHNDGRRLVHAREVLGAAAGWPKALVAVLTADVDRDGYPDFLLWSETAGLQLYRNQGNGNRSLPIVLTGRRDDEKPARCNSDGIGAWVRGQTAEHATTIEWTTFYSGLGQSRQPVLLGLGKADQAEFVRVRWPDNVLQAELNLPAGQLKRIEETNRKPVSCPILFAWDGHSFGFVTDFLGAGSMGELLPGGGCRPPRPEESVKIEARQLVPQNGHFVLKIAEPMDEVTYLDRLQLVAVDHPVEVQVYPDERFIADPRGPSQDLLAFATQRQILPLRATDHRGRDMTEVLRKWDRVTADGFAKRAWIGYAEEHWVELDFGDRLAAFGASDPIQMFLAGWTDYPFPESIWAATQAGVDLAPPQMERWVDGRWQTVPIEVGFPAGLTRMMTVDVTGHLTGPTCKVRLRTNMHVYWDQVFVAPVLCRLPAGQPASSSSAFRTHPLDVQKASLVARGCVQEFSPDGREPTVYTHDRLDPVPVVRLAGNLTRLGDVTELLRHRDDRFLVFGPGDEVTVAFAADGLPSLPAGWVRSYVLRTWGYCKDAGPFTATGDTIEPLPFRGMTRFPFGANERYPRTPLHDAYIRDYQTRKTGR